MSNCTVSGYPPEIHSVDSAWKEFAWKWASAETGAGTKKKSVPQHEAAPSCFLNEQAAWRHFATEVEILISDQGNTVM